MAAMTELAPRLTDLVLATRTVSEQGGACPFQAQGTILGMPFYFRFREDFASLAIGDAESVGRSEVTGNPYSGFLSNEEFEAIFRKLLKRYLKSLKY